MATRSKGAALGSAMSGRQVRISIPAEVAGNMVKFQKAIKSLGERLGCPACLSGVDCSFQIEKGYVVNPETLGIDSLKGVVIIDG